MTDHTLKSLTVKQIFSASSHHTAGMGNQGI